MESKQRKEGEKARDRETERERVLVREKVGRGKGAGMGVERGGEVEGGGGGLRGRSQCLDFNVLSTSQGHLRTNTHRYQSASTLDNLIPMVPNRTQISLGTVGGGGGERQTDRHKER